MILNNGEVAVDPITVLAHSTATIDISGFMENRGFNDTHGTVAVKFDAASYGAGSAVVQIHNKKNDFFLNSYAQSPEAYWTGREYDAVVWAPDEDTKGFISITNTSDEVQEVYVKFLIKGRSEKQREIKIPPRFTRYIPINNLLAQSQKSAIGINIEYEQEYDEQYAGAILVEGQMFNTKTGFAKNIRFMNKALPPTGTLRTHFLMLGRQLAEDYFPTDVYFKSIVAFRNVESVPVKVTPIVKFVQDGALKTIKLSTRSLKPDESQLIDFEDEQKKGNLPQDFSQGSLELLPYTDHASIVAELYTFNQSGDYVVGGSSFSSYPTRSTASIWRIDGSFQTTIMIENTSTQNDRVTMNLYSESGQYSKTFGLTSGKILKVNIRSLQQDRIPDDDGNFILGTSGIMTLVGNNNTKSRFSYDKIVHSINQSDYIGLPPNPCDYVTGILQWVDFDSGSPQFTVMKTYSWSISGEFHSTQSGVVSSDTNLAQITSDGSGNTVVTFTPPDDGQEYIVWISPQFPTENAPNCIGCSGGNVNVGSVSPIKIGIRYSAYKWDGTVNLGCTYIPSCQGTCTQSVRYFSGQNPPNCTPFVQCADLYVSIYGQSPRCLWVGKCTAVPVAGKCT